MISNNNTCNSNSNDRPTVLDLKCLKIAAVNANSIVSHAKRFDILNFIDNFDLDILLISETKLTNRHKITFPGKVILRTDRPNAKKGGGTAIIFNEKISYNVIYTPSSKKIKLLNLQS